MRKKEPPPFPTMAAAGHNAQRNPSVARALEWKRRSIDQEIKEFRAKKEQEYKNFEERLSNGQLPEERGASQTDAATAEKGALQPQQPVVDVRVANGEYATRPSGGDAAYVWTPTTPTTPKHEKEHDLHGLFLPHFIPLIDSSTSHNHRAPPSPSSTGSDAHLQNGHGKELPAAPSGVTSPDPSALSPRTSPSPTLIAIPSPPPRNLYPTSQPSTTLPSRENLEHSPSPAEDIPSDLPLLTRSPARTPPSGSPPTELVAPKPTRPELGTRTSSTQSDGSVYSLRSSFRKVNGSSSHGRKKSVRITIDDIVLEPGGQSPAQLRNGWRIPERTNGDSSGIEGGRKPLTTSSHTKSKPVTEPAHVENVSSPGPKNGALAAQSHVDSIVKRQEDKTPKRDRRPASLDRLSARASNSGSDQNSASNAPDPYPSFYPPQPLRSPSTAPSPRLYGRDLIEPIKTPPANDDVDQDDLFSSDPLFGESGRSDGPRRTSGQEGATEGRRKSGKPGFEVDEEDMFQNYEDGREDMDVVNGHDWGGDDDADDFDADAMAKNGRAISNEGSDAWENITSTSPHAGSLPIEIRGPRGWGARAWR